MTGTDKLIFLKSIVDDVSDEFTEEDILHIMLEKKISADIIVEEEKEPSFGERMADRIASFTGSWAFIGLFLLFLILWMGLNLLLATKAFDPYPFILMNLVLSCIAAIQAPLIMMSQNRQEEKDRRRADNTYKINLKSEFIIEDLHHKMDRILDNQQRILDILRENDS